MDQVKGQLKGQGFASHPENINRAGGPPKTHWWTELLIAEANKDSLIAEVQKDNEKQKKLKKKEMIAKALVEKAESGDMAAIREFGDRVQGKSPQGIGVIDDDGAFKEQGGFIYLPEKKPEGHGA